jgi:N-acetylmuramic acid 6-phosphate etherase
VVTKSGSDLDLLPAADVVDLLLQAEAAVVPAVRARRAEIARAADLVADRLDAGARLLFAGAGTSGRIAAAEAAELPGTFGLDPARVVALVAGGAASVDHDEDDIAAAARDLAQVAVGPDDVLVAVAASGSTPYTLAVARAARDLGATVLAVVNVAGSPLADAATVAVEVVVGEEVVRGSTRLTAGTAQKLVLNALTTAAMARAGRVHADLMVDVVPANAKLRDRSAGIVAEIAGVPPAVARAALDRCDQEARAAVVHLVTGLAPGSARERARQHRTLRAALADPEVSSP